MALVFKARVGEASISTGTGAFSLLGALTGHQTFASVCSVSDTVEYAIVAVDANGAPTGEWETGTGTYSGANTLTRTTVAESSNAGSAVSFSAGDKVVLLTPLSSRIGSIFAPNLANITDATVASTGLLTGGVLSTGAGATQFSISDGTGLIVSEAGAITQVSWTGKSNITPTNLASQLLTFVAIDSGGNVVESGSPFSASARRSNIVLGAIVHVDKATVDNVNNEQVVAYQPLSTAADIAAVLGFANVSGNVFSANGANLSIDKSSGVLFHLGSNYNIDTTNPHNRTLAALSPCTFQYRFSNGSNGTTGTTIDPDNLDNGSGGLTALANNQWSVQRIYSFISNNVKVQRGVESFATKEAAIAGIASEPYVTEPSIAANGLLRGWLVVRKGATALNGVDAEFLPAPKFGESSVSGITNPAGDAQAILLPALKATAGSISVGQVVQSAGYSGGKLLVELADADGVGTMPAIGVVREAMTDSVDGVVIFSGILAGVNTSTYSVGDALYVSTTPGSMTNVRPTALGAGIQAVARVLSVDATAGVIQVVGAGRSNDIPNFTAADQFWYGAANGVATEANITAAGRALIDDADATAQRTTLGLGTSATLNTGTSAGTVALGNHTHTGVYEAANANIQSHIGSTSNPHSVTAAQAGAMATSHPANSITGFGASGAATTVARSDHNHSGTYEPADATILKSANIGSTVQGYDGDLAAIAALAGTSGLARKTAADTWSLDTNTYLTGNQSITFSGDASGTGTTAVTLTLATVPVSKGGTGATTLTGLLTGNGTSAFSAAVSGTDIKTVNSTSLLGSGDVAVQATLVSGTNIKTVNSTSLLGSGDIAVVAATSGTASGITLNDGYTEEVFAVSGTTPALSPTNGSIQTWTLSGNSTPTAGTWAAGQSITLMIDDGTAYTVTWTSLAVTWKTDAGSAPTLNTSGYTAIALWKVGSTIYGARVGDA